MLFYVFVLVSSILAISPYEYVLVNWKIHYISIYCKTFFLNISDFFKFSNLHKKQGRQILPAL